MSDITTLFRPVGSGELLLIEESDYRAFPPRLFWQPVFYPLLSEAYARLVARNWNTQYGQSGYVTQFDVNTNFLRQYTVQNIGSDIHQEYWIPAKDLPAFNQNIVGRIDVIAVYSSAPTLPETDT